MWTSMDGSSAERKVLHVSLPIISCHGHGKVSTQISKNSPRRGLVLSVEIQEAACHPQSIRNLLLGILNHTGQIESQQAALHCDACVPC